MLTEMLQQDERVNAGNKQGQQQDLATQDPSVTRDMFTGHIVLQQSC